MKRAFLFSVLCMALGLSVPGCGTSDSSQQQGNTQNPPQQVGFSTVLESRVSSSGINALQLSVIHNDAEWTTFWNLLNANSIPKPALPSVNFADNVVIALVDQMAMGVNSFRVTGIQSVPTGVSVKASRVSAGQGCAVAQDFSQNFHIVTTPKFSGSATLDLSQSFINCGP